VIEKASLKEIQGFVQPFDELPIPELNLQHKEDLLVQKVKRRPAVLVVREGYNMRRFSEWSANLGKRPNPTRHVFAPIVSLRKQGNLGRDYPEAFIDKVSAAEYPEFIYLPPTERVITTDSMAVLTELQVHSCTIR